MAGCGYKMFLPYSRNVRGLQLKKRPGGEFTRALPVSRRWNSVDVVLLPVEGGVGLDDDVFVGVLLEFVDEHGLAGLERLGDFRVHAEREVRTFMLGGAGHLARFGLDFVAQRWNGLDHAGAGAVRAGLAEDALEGLLGALAGDADETEFVEGKRFRGRFVLLEGHLESGQNLFAVAALFHVNEVHDNDAAEVAQTDLADDLFHGLEVGLDDGVFEARGTLADEFAGVDIDGHESFGVVDDDVAAGLEPDLGAESFVELVLDAELFEDRGFLGVELDAADELGLEAADELDDLAILLFAVNPDGGEIVANVIAEHTLNEIEVTMEKRGGLALFALLLDFVPRFAEEFDIGANFLVGGAAGGGANDEAARIGVAGFADKAAKPRTIFRGDNFARYPGVMDRGHVDQEAARQGDVAGDARALLAERLLGDLDDDILTGLEHFRNELRAARRAGISVMPTVMPRAARTTAFEARAASTVTAAAIGTPAVAAVTSAAAERPLEARARVAADASGIARKILSRRAGSTTARTAGFAREQGDIVFDDGGFCGGFAGRRRDHFLFGMFDFGMFMLGGLVLAERGCVFGAVMRRVRSEFRAAGRTARFDFLGFFLGELRSFHRMNFLGLFGGLIRLFLGFFLGFFLFELRTADDSVGGCDFLSLFVLCFNDSGSERGELIFVQIGVIGSVFGFVSGRIG